MQELWLDSSARADDDADPMKGVSLQQEPLKSLSMEATGSDLQLRNFILGFAKENSW